MTDTREISLEQAKAEEQIRYDAIVGALRDYATYVDSVGTDKPTGTTKSIVDSLVDMGVTKWYDRIRDTGLRQIRERFGSGN